LAIKADILRIQQTKGLVTKDDILALPYAVDGERLIRLLGFFARMEWITSG
jgi:hypothetical protein